jgi:hypothetical protein
MRRVHEVEQLDSQQPSSYLRVLGFVVTSLCTPPALIHGTRMCTLVREGGRSGRAWCVEGVGG